MRPPESRDVHLRATTEGASALSARAASEPQFAWFPSAGARLRAGIWRADHARRLCLLLHGLTEFIEKYGEVASELVARGFDVASLDWRGQGANARSLPDSRKAHIGDFAQFDGDLSAFLDGIVEPINARPRVALAHSMGAHILLRRLHQFPRDVACAVLVAPMLRVQTGDYPYWFTRALTWLHNMSEPSPAYVWGSRNRNPLALAFEESGVTSDRARYARTQKFLLDHPDYAISGPTFGWLEASFRSMARMRKPDYAEAITTPLLVFGAGRDQIVGTDAIRAFVKRLPNVRYVELADAEHEILMENDSIRARFWKEFDAFVAQYAP